jgi:hypothetical protein
VNNEQVKSLLERVRPAPAPFQVVLSGKKSRKVHGLYKPEKREIILHNRNFTTEEELVYTALHEYAHHLQFCTPPVPRSARTHTIRFWSLFHGLLSDAERAGLYRSPFERIEDFRRLTAQIKERIIAPNGALMKELGRLLAEAQALCDQHHASYTDYLDRVLALPKPGADAAVKSHLLDLDPRLGSENMRLVARVRDPQARARAQEALLAGESHDTVKAMSFPRPPAAEEDSLEALQAERKRLERTIKRLEKRLELVNERLAALEQ